MSRKVIFVANRGYALYSSRKLIIERFLNKGWKVGIFTSNDEYSQKLSKLGAEIIDLDIYREGFSLYNDTKTFIKTLNIYRKYKPDLIHQFHAKPIILGNAASIFASNKTKMISTLTGLGYPFTAGGVLKKLAGTGYNLFLNRSDKVIFQNRDDRQLFIDNNWISADKAELIVSSGIEVDDFEFVGYDGDDKDIKVLIATRLLGEKGIKEYVEAAEIIKSKRDNIRFQLGGELDSSHPDSISQAWIEEKDKKGIIEFLGYIEDMPEKLKEIDLFVFPSYYREGVPRVLLEAAATGKPVVTTDAPGCREAVIDGETGKLVPPRDSQALAEAILSLVDEEEKRKEMGSKGRKRVEKEFDIKEITEQYFEVYRKLGFDI